MSIESNEIEMFRDIQGWWHLHICRNIAGVADLRYFFKFAHNKQFLL